MPKYDQHDLIETPIQFDRGSRNVEVVLTRAVDLQGKILLPQGVDGDDLCIALIQDDCPPRIRDA